MFDWCRWLVSWARGDLVKRLLSPYPERRGWIKINPGFFSTGVSLNGWQEQFYCRVLESTVRYGYDTSVAFQAMRNGKICLNVDGHEFAGYEPGRDPCNPLGFSFDREGKHWMAQGRCGSQTAVIWDHQLRLVDEAQSFFRFVDDKPVYFCRSGGNWHFMSGFDVVCSWPQETFHREYKDPTAYGGEQIFDENPISVDVSGKHCAFIVAERRPDDGETAVATELYLDGIPVEAPGRPLLSFTTRFDLNLEYAAHMYDIPDVGYAAVVFDLATGMRVRIVPNARLLFDRIDDYTSFPSELYQ